ncbi:hypothetical protein [Demequina aurantiaca]|uniref:hypothetical protein n=1 Tax=Demequina aurantiaca TaxID=676200 RepID=UPI003D353BA7
MRTTTIHGLAATTVAAFAAVALLAGCSNPIEKLGNNLAEAGTEKLAEELTGGDVQIDLDGSGADLPADWPSDVVLPDGQILLAVSQDDGQMAQIKVSGTDAFDEMASNLENAGFEEGESLDNEVMKIRIFQRDDMGATVGLIDLDGEFVLQVTVAATDS